MSEMLVEKWRPKEFKEVINLNPAIIEMVNKKDIPHLLFAGSPGGGKTTTAKIIINKLGCECLMLNASDERGINTIREKVKSFAMTSSMNGMFKVVFLDEFDALLGPSQDCLRNILETYHKNCRMIATCNYINKIIPALQSRFVKFEFETPKKEDIYDRVKYIADEEHIRIMAEAVVKIVDIYYPDIRKSINKLQELGNLNRLITPEDIHIHDKIIPQLIELTKKGDFVGARQLSLDSSLDHHAISKQLWEYVLESKDITPKLKSELMDVMDYCNVNITRVVFPETSFEYLLLGFIRKFAWAKKGYPDANEKLIKEVRIIVKEEFKLMKEELKDIKNVRSNEESAIREY